MPGVNPAERNNPIIPPVTEEANRPLWSVMIPTFNSAAYLAEALTSVLAQDPGPEGMQIEVVDDCSTRDDPEAVVNRLGNGRVCFYRQPVNVGHAGNFNTCLQRSKGRLVHLLHSDDCVRPGFYRKMQRLLEQHPEIGAAFCRHIWMDENGHWLHISRLRQDQSGILQNSLEIISAQQPVQTPAMVVRREVYERLGGFDDRMSACGEDWEMWVRIAANYPIGYEVEPLALYRKHTSSLSARSLRSGQNIQDVRRAIDIYRAYLPAAQADAWTARARELCAHWAIDTADQMISVGETQAARAQLREALWSSRSIKVLLHAVRLSLRSRFRKNIPR